MHGMVQEFSSELCRLSDHVQVDTYSKLCCLFLRALCKVHSVCMYIYMYIYIYIHIYIHNLPTAPSGMLVDT